MKYLIRFYLIAILAALYSGNGVAKTFKIATLAPAGTTWMNEMQQGAKIIDEKTLGRVKFKFYPGGVMGNDQSVHRKIKVGQLHGGAFTSGGLAHIYSGIQVLSLPMAFNSLDEVDYVRSKMDSSLKQNMEQGGFVLLGIAGGGFARIMSKQPLTDLKAIRSSKVWIPEGDTMVQETYKTLGISAISLPISDVFTGLQTGLIDTVTVTSTAAISFQWHSSTAYITDAPVIYLTGLLALQKESFDKIKAEDQVIVKQEIDHVFKRLDRLNRADNENATIALKNHGIKFVKPGPEELNRWKLLSAESIANMTNQGIVAKQAVDEVMQHLSDYRKAR
jgi:TRAP-type C4-dicarboxylate transport system substrate-binding protein